MSGIVVMMGRICNGLHGLKPALLMVMVQIVFAGVNVLYKLAANDGMSLKVLVAYRFIFAAAFIVPVALVFERKSRPKLTWVVVFQAFLCGLFGGTLAQNLYLESLALTSATFASAMANLVPAITFIMSITFGLERLGLRTLAGKAKVVGTLIGVSGAMLLTFYKGVEINIWSTHVNLLQDAQHRGGHVASPEGEPSNRLMGALLAVGSCLSYAIWLIIQAKMSEGYPSHYSSTAMMNVMASIQSAAFAFCIEKDWSQWRLGWNIRLLTVAYAGIWASGLMVSVIAWCVHMRGPLFASVFNPLMLVLVAILGSLILNEKLHLGSVIGAVLIVCGLYVVLWGKSTEFKRITQLMPSESSTETESVEIVVTSSMENNDNNDKDSVKRVATDSLPKMVNNSIEGDLMAKEEEQEEEVNFIAQRGALICTNVVV